MLMTHSSTNVLSAIAARSRTLPEQLHTLLADSLPTPDSSPETQAEIDRRLDFWCQVVAKGNWETFQKRLDWEDLPLETAHLLVSEALFQNPSLDVEPLPAWIKVLQQIIDAALAQSRSKSTSHRVLDPDRPIPFEHLSLPSVQVAQSLLKQRLEATDYIHLLSDSTQITLERKLLEALATLCTSALFDEFSRFRSTGDSLRDFLLLSLQSAPRCDQYQAFVDRHLQDGLLSLFEQYSVLARLVVTSVQSWVEATAEFLTRLTTDWTAIQQTFSPDRALTQVVSIEASIADAHKGGRSVMILTFDTGLKVVYKPRELALEVVFGEFLTWCNQHAIALPLKAPTVLDYRTYGWVEYIAAIPCESEAAVRRYYQRSGMLLCLIHTLEGTDYHYENLIAHGEYPILVDMEALLHPQMATQLGEFSDATLLLSHKLSHSVLRTSLLPQTKLSVSDLFSFDVSGLGKLEEQSIPTSTWKHINTDGMQVTYDSFSQVLEQKSNVPTLKDRLATPESYIGEIVTGFEQMYRWLIQHRELLLSDQSPLQRFAHQECRFLFRNTQTYSGILVRSLTPRLLQAGVARSIGLDVLSRAYLTFPEKPRCWSILEAEKSAMEQLDIPLLSVNTSSLDVVLPTGTVIANLFDRSSFDRVCDRIQALDESDLAFQSQVIQTAFYARFLEEPQFEASDPINLSQLKQHSVSSEQFVDEAITIAQTLRRSAIMAEDGSVSWLGASYQHRTQSFSIQRIGMNLYDGQCGLALYFAALYHITQDSTWREFALLTLNPLSQAIHAQDLTVTKLANFLGIGGGDGLGSIVYALTWISQWLQAPEFVEDAQRVATWITPEEISADRTFDVIGGAAGTILGLLALLPQVKASERTILREQAIACGQNLLTHQTGTEGAKAWQTWRRQKALTGFSRGAAGIAYALLRLYAVTEDSQFFDAALAAIAYEQTQFSPETQTWRDLRSQPNQTQLSWAQGAPGIALARLGSLSVLDTPEIREQIAIALNTTQRSILWGNDALCWGNFGRIETVLCAAQQLDQPERLSFARQTASTVLNRAQTQGGFTLSEVIPPGVSDPGFFHGLSGIGYQLLRIAHPDRLPSVLLWEG
ncbi:type 2 lanthipeptide synthetase LanM family protein [Leptolyngbya boryana CZ1]|uniref:Type 2 lanthipeptide synthetase LanM family protein n=1 Tax=Leptolyngbya boryana CZ1 TaxID=3060204 RepID=A0AA96WTJ3_LEPBY|nr:type 2 lanthipeptide synthetase LanM family protein [Leptolyngbya boryana]WNZ43909.1 type 2 lanthipeptide synthetase LanM family protein [Leptolyngbya boryana CZ1]